MIGLFAFLTVLGAGLAAPVGAASVSASDMERLRAADIVIIGEIHDNPHHHAVQAQLVAALNPAALVWEMLTPEQADRITPDLITRPAQLAEALEWDQSGWPAFALYAPIFAAAKDARMIGALVPRAQIRAAFQGGGAAMFGPQAEAFGLTQPLPDTQQQRREAVQLAAHCDALPADMLPAMVGVQRLRDAVLARAAIRGAAFGPVVVITGNGHARKDWGAPAFIAQVAPALRVLTIGQGEDGQAPPGGFDLLLDAPAVDRPDPCAAFRS